MDEALKREKKMKTYKIVKWVREEFEVEAENRKEALQVCFDPYATIVTKETCVELKP